MGSIIATKSLEVLPMDFTQHEPVSDGHENVLVIPNVFTKFTLVYLKCSVYLKLPWIGNVSSKI